ncbi:LPS-assembly protein LptD [sulfur-oxidizing endosymbiont of Gigantopelta aegis]|uniref:LPS-assembly protein LptD n=1 Tax=sulfur-oxidizing endosymbiont of Gigantopelta aegis TaxID=2794934 RepID=UPI001BE40D0F|nr:LPS-assembly protein LptD [sulfur-oxidizing endosymbiont of Gigantopelta aegis]
MLSSTAIADVYQSNGWQCQPLADGKWNCAVADGPLAPQLDSISGKRIIPQPVAAVVIAKPSFPEPDFSDPNVGPTGGGTVVQPRLKAISGAASGLWSSCAVKPLAEYDRKSMAAQADESTNVEADDAQSPDSEQINFSGNVVITKNIQKLTSDQATYNKTSGMFNAEGNVIITEPNMVLRGDTARYQTDDRKGRVDNAIYELPARPAQGIADNIRFKPGEIDLENPTYSTCPVGDQDWVISADEMKLYTEEGYGVARGAVMRFKGFPIAYTPYISFPLNDDRKSGFLMPTVGNSDTNGVEIATPYYFNIAPDQDATITPRLLSDRGLMLGGEYRYLSDNQSGEVYAEWLNDRSYDDKRDAVDVALREGPINATGKVVPKDISKNRGAFSLQQRANWQNGWSGNVDYNYVSDRYYLDDFGNNLRDKSQTHLLREGSLNYNGSIFDFTARAQGYQELQANRHTYSRLPQLLLSGDDSFTPFGIDLDAGFTSEFVMFAQNWEDTVYDQNDDIERVEGSRLHIKPSLSVPFKNSYAYLTPKVSLDMVTYNLDNEDQDVRYGGSVSNPNGTILTDDSPSRVEPIVSIDSGLFFDRNLTLFDTSLQQTLEPRLFYLYVPEDNQSDIPIFDTGLSSFSFNQLFRENRFTGADRLGDANQMTAALTTRFIDDGSGSELFTASIGQIYYFSDREVTLNYNRLTGEPSTTEKYANRLNNSSSSIAAQVSSRFSRNWYTSYSLLYNPYESGTTDEARYRLQYKSDKNHLANIDYSYRAKDYEQIELSTYWKIAPQWQALAHWYYSLYDFDTTRLNFATGQTPADARSGYLLDSKLGIEYDSCCYALRLVVGRDQKNYYADANNYVMLQVQFKGLGSLTQSLAGRGHRLEQDIPGFEPWKN